MGDGAGSEGGYKAVVGMVDVGEGEVGGLPETSIGNR